MACYPLFAHARKTPWFHWGIVYHRLRTVNLYRILAYSSEARPSRAYPANMAGKSEDFDKAHKYALCCIGKGDFMLKAEQLETEGPPLVSLGRFLHTLAVSSVRTEPAYAGVAREPVVEIKF